MRNDVGQSLAAMAKRYHAERIEKVAGVQAALRELLQLRKLVAGGVGAFGDDAAKFAAARSRLAGLTEKYGKQVGMEQLGAAAGSIGSAGQASGKTISRTVAARFGGARRPVAAGGPSGGTLNAERSASWWRGNDSASARSALGSHGFRATVASQAGRRTAVRTPGGAWSDNLFAAGDGRHTFLPVNAGKVGLSGAPGMPARKVSNLRQMEDKARAQIAAQPPKAPAAPAPEPASAFKTKAPADAPKPPVQTNVPPPPKAQSAPAPEQAAPGAFKAPETPPGPTSSPNPALGSQTIGEQAQKLSMGRRVRNFFTAEGRATNRIAAVERQGASDAAALSRQTRVDLAAAGVRRRHVEAGRQYADQLRARGMPEHEIEGLVNQRFGARGFGGGSVVDDIMGRAPAVPEGGARSPAAPGGKERSPAAPRESGGRQSQSDSLGTRSVKESASRLAQMSPAEYWDWVRKNPGKTALGGAAAIGGAHVLGNVFGGGGSRRHGGAVVTY